MALPIITPALTKTRAAVAQGSQRAILKIVPELETGSRISRRSLGMLSTVLGLILILIMFAITSMSTQDAFTLAKLQREAQLISDEREAINSQIAHKSSPMALASEARKLGMSLNSQPRFIDIDSQANG